MSLSTNESVNEKDATYKGAKHYEQTWNGIIGQLRIKVIIKLDSHVETLL